MIRDKRASKGQEKSTTEEKDELHEGDNTSMTKESHDEEHLTENQVHEDKVCTDNIPANILLLHSILVKLNNCAHMIIFM
jgi:hypothetical protein